MLLAKVAMWAIAIVVGYFAVAAVAVPVALHVMLTPGIIDWAGERRSAPSFPLTIGYRGDPQRALNYTFETVLYETERGPAEAWLVPAATPSTLWAVFVHGIGGLRENGYRQLRILHEAGVPVLMITYRNDAAAPASADQLFSFGLSEWRDVEAAVDVVVGRGADRVLLVAESMGAAITGQYLRRGRNADRIAGLALDSPALDFPEVIRSGLRRHWAPFPATVTDLGLGAWALLRTDMRAAVAMDDIVAFEGPVFVAHAGRDPVVPVEISERLKQLRPATDYLRTDADQHLHSFAVAPNAYRAGMRRLIEAVRR